MSTVDPVVPKKSNAPTKKWWVTQITAAAGIAIMFVTTGGWDTEESVALVTLVTQAALGWLKSNDPAPGGVPVE